MAEENKKKILILDDDKFLVNMYASKFQNQGITTEVANTGNELLDKITNGYEPDLLLLDIIIPGMNGLDTLEEVRKRGLAKDAKVVMLTNQSDDDDIERAKSLKVQGYIAKSTSTPSEVASEVIKIMNS